MKIFSLVKPTPCEYCPLHDSVGKTVFPDWPWEWEEPFQAPNFQGGFLFLQPPKLFGQDFLINNDYFSAMKTYIILPPQGGGGGSSGRSSLKFWDTISLSLKTIFQQ